MKRIQRRILGSKCSITYHTNYFEGVPPQVVPITPHHVMHADEETIIHDVHLFQELRVSFELLCEECPLLRPQLQSLASVDPVEVLERDLVLFFGGLFLRVESTNCAALEVVSLVNIFVWREKVVHDDKVNLPPPRQFYTMKTIEA